MSSSKHELPKDLAEEVKLVTINLLPKKSIEWYENEYIMFEQWLEGRRVKMRICHTVVFFAASRIKTIIIVDQILHVAISAKSYRTYRYQVFKISTIFQKRSYVLKKSLILKRDEIARYSMLKFYKCVLNFSSPGGR